MLLLRIRTEGLGNGHIRQDGHNRHQNNAAAQLVQDVGEDIGAILMLKGEGRQLDAGHGRGDLRGERKGHCLH